MDFGALTFLSALENSATARKEKMNSQTVRDLIRPSVVRTNHEPSGSVAYFLNQKSRIVLPIRSLSERSGDDA